MIRQDNVIETALLDSMPIKVYTVKYTSIWSSKAIINLKKNKIKKKKKGGNVILG